jgi:hypothetical protein
MARAGQDNKLIEEEGRLTKIQVCYNSINEDFETHHNLDHETKHDSSLEADDAITGFGMVC